MLNQLMLAAVITIDTEILAILGTTVVAFFGWMIHISVTLMVMKSKVQEILALRIDMKDIQTRLTHVEAKCKLFYGETKSSVLPQPAIEGV